MPPTMVTVVTNVPSGFSTLTSLPKITAPVSSPACINLDRMLPSSSTDRRRIDDRLNAAGDLRVPEHEHEFVGSIADQLGGVDVLEDVDAVLRDQSLVHLEHPDPRLE